MSSKFKLWIVLLTITFGLIYYQFSYKAQAEILSLDILEKQVSEMDGKFEVGDCVSLVAHYESWESPVVQQLLERGENAYRVCVLPGCNIDSNFSISFRNLRYYEKVQCPPN